jgi:hypothetical protein
MSKTKGTLLGVLGLGLAAGACGPVQVAGGPSRSTLTLNPANLGGELRPLVRDEPEALAKLDRVEGNRTKSQIFLWSGMGALGGCLLLSNQTVNQPKVSSSSYGLIMGTCGLSIGLEIVSIIYAPTYGDYGDVLRAYNARHPSTAWSSERLGVEAPLPPPATLPLPGAPPAAMAVETTTAH